MIVIAPLYVPAARLVAFTETVSEPGVEPEVGATDNQLPPEVVDAAAVKLIAAPLLATESDCAAGLPAPIWNANAIDAGEAESVGAGVTVNVTGTFTGLFDAPAEVMAIVPLYVPTTSPAPLTDTLSAAGVEPDAGVTPSQLPPDVVDAAAVKLITGPLLATESGCDAGLLPPACMLNAKDAGPTESVGRVVIVRVTGTDSGLLEAPAEVSVMAPL